MSPLGLAAIAGRIPGDEGSSGQGSAGQGSADQGSAGRGSGKGSSRSDRVADIVREAILDGTFRWGTRLSEPQICAAVNVSRNTLREAFRTLAEERLVVHELNRGVFVRVPTAQDVSELYACRRIVECAAVRACTGSPGELDGVTAALDRADALAGSQDWIGVGTADIAFHRALVALSRNERLVRMTAGVWNEMRLVFHVVGEPAGFHGSYLARNHALAATLATGDTAAAAAELHAYLDDAERHTLQTYRQRSLAGG